MNPDLQTKKFQSSDLGNYIKSPRKFGVEIEMFSVESGGVSFLKTVVDRSFGLVHDGSIQGGKEQIEVVSPILAGKVGENALLKTLDTINESKLFNVNDSCGLHVHIDGNDFLTKNKIVVSKAFDSIGGFNVSFSDFLIEKSLYEYLHVGESMSNKEIRDLIIPVEKKWKAKYKTDCKDYPKQLSVITEDIIIPNQKTIRIKECESHLGGLGIVSFPKFVFDNKKTDSVMSVGLDTSSTEKLRNLMLIYTIFDQIFLSMLSERRRENERYNRSLTKRIHPNGILKCKTRSDLEQLWFQSEDKRDITRKKGDKYDESRYYGVNFHALFAKYGTVEVRWLEGTLNPVSILSWVAIHQHIVDVINSSSINGKELYRQTERYFLTDTQGMFRFFLDFFNFPPHLEKYMSHRVEFFNK